MSKFSVFHSDLLNETYHFYRHSSGLKIYVFPKKLTTTYALLAADFGSVDRTGADGEKYPAGVAHFLEHKLFSNEDGSDSFEKFSALGADANAYTAATRTVYLFSATERVKEALTELIRFVTHPYFTEESVAKERGIIGEEIRQTEDNPYNRAYYQMLRGLYAAHPVKDEICGSLASVEEITPNVLYRAYRSYYTPANLTLVVCGNIAPEAVAKIAEEELPPTPGAPRPPRVIIKESAAALTRVAKIRGQVAKPAFCIGMKDDGYRLCAAERTKRDAGFAVLSEMLFSQSGELFNELFGSGEIGADFTADYALTEGFSYLRLFGEADDPERVFEKILAYFEKKRETGFSPAEFERCRRVEYAEYIKGFDSTEEIAETLLCFTLEGAEIFEYAKVLQDLDFAYVENLFREAFLPERFTLSAVYPEEEREE